MSRWHWSFRITWHHQERDYLISRVALPVSGPLEPRLHFQLLWR